MMGADPAIETAALTGAAQTRSALYWFLSLAFLPPEDLQALRAATAAAASALRTIQPDGQETLTAVELAARLLAGTEQTALGESYRRTFGHQISTDCPLYETQYGVPHVFQQVQQMADIAGFYLAFGLDVAEDVHERPDHISLELEFMHALAFREAHALTHHGPEEVALLRDAQRAFLRDHLARWVPSLTRVLRRKADGFYRCIADAADAWIAAEAASYGFAPAPEVDLAPVAAMPDVPAGCEVNGCGPEARS